MAGMATRDSFRTILSPIKLLALECSKIKEAIRAAEEAVAVIRREAASVGETIMAAVAVDGTTRIVSRTIRTLGSSRISPHQVASAQARWAVCKAIRILSRSLACSALAPTRDSRKTTLADLDPASDRATKVEDNLVHKARIKLATIALLSILTRQLRADSAPEPE